MSIERISKNITQVSEDFEFYYVDGFFPFKGGRTYKIYYYSDKSEVYTDISGNVLFRVKNPTLFSKYVAAAKGLSRESYLKPYKIVLTKRMKGKDTIIRYFAQYKLDKYDRIFEIDKQNFNRESNFYNKVFVTWQLKGSKENILMKNKESLELAEGLLHGIQNFLDPLQFYEEDITSVEKLQKKLSRLKFVPDSTDTSSDLPSGWNAGDVPPPGSGY